MHATRIKSVKSDHSKSARRFNRAAFFFTFCVLFALWLVLSGQFDLFHVGFGLLCATLVAYLSHDLLLPNYEVAGSVGILLRFCRYLPWLFYQILLANLHVVKLVLHPRLPIAPRIVELHTGLKSEWALTTLATSITLTPGTITADVREGTLCVHAITQKVADDLLSGEMEKRVAAIYREDKRPMARKD